MTRKSESSPREERFDIGFYLVSLVVCFVVYLGVGDNGFYKDDFLWMLAARDDMSAGNVFTYRLVGFFRPLTNLAFFLTERIHPGSSLFYNNTNLLIHFGNGVLIYHFLRRLGRELFPASARFVSAAAALLFIAGYTHSGAVVWVSARTTLLMTSFVLGALIFALGGRRSIASVLLFTMALLTKETAIAGLALVVVLYLVLRARRGVGGGTVVAFAVASVAYLVLRTVILQSTFQDNWGPGWHVATNLLGAILYVFYPWVLTPLAGSEAALSASAQTAWPELLALPVLAVLFLLGRAAGRGRAMLLALSWLVVALVPAALFRFRFLDTVSHVHNRYYYLASVGAVLAIALLLGWLWERKPSRSFGAAQVGALALLLLMVASSAVPVRTLERYWGNSNARFESLVGTTVGYLDQFPDQPTVVVSGIDGWQPFLSGAAQYQRPQRPIIYVKGGADEAAAHAPCLYVKMIRGTGGKVSLELSEIE